MLACAFGHHQVEEREVIAEGEDALRIGDLRVLPEAGAKSDSAIGVTYSCEKRTSVRTKSASPGVHRRRRRAGAGAARRRSRGAAMIFSHEGHRPRRRRDRRRRDLARQARAVVGEEPAVLDDRGADRDRARA